MKKNSYAVKKKLSEIASHQVIADKLGLTRQAVGAWFKRGVPARHVIALEKATGGKVTRYELRPDLYPRD